MKTLNILALIAIISFSACKKSKNTNSTTELDKKAKEEVKLIKFQKSMCYGKCPAYEATIYPDGKIDFNGVRFTPIEGAHELKAAENFTALILEKANSINFFSLDDKYDNQYVTDVPSTTLFIETTTRQKQVYARYEMPKELIELNEYVHAEIMRLAEERKGQVESIKKPLPPVKYKNIVPIEEKIQKKER